jgi:hypothetical protein
VSPKEDGSELAAWDTRDTFEGADHEIYAGPD